MLVIEGARPGSDVAGAAHAWLEIAQTLAQVVGVWEEPALPALPAGATRITMLTPAGPRFGQGPDAALRKDRAAGAYLAAATRVLTTVLALGRS